MGRAATVASAIKAEVARLNVEAEAPGMTALALSLARAVDASAKAPAAKAVAARELRAVMNELRKLAPVRAAEGDAVDEVNRQRQKRRAAVREQASGD